MTADDLIAFEARVAAAMERGEVRGPVHLSGGNESQLINIFREVKPRDWVFSTYRSHYHALLHGLPPAWLYSEILDGHSMSLQSHMHRFYTSAIVGGCLPIALGVAAGIKRRGGQEKVWCFIGDMGWSTYGGICYDYADSLFLPIRFVIEDNGYSTNTPTHEAWGFGSADQQYWHFNEDKTIFRYHYQRTSEHIGAKSGVSFS